MPYPLQVPGLEGRSVQVETATWTGAARVLLDGRPAPPGAGKREYRLTRPDGTVAVVRLTGAGLDLTPRVTVDGVAQTVAPPLHWYEWGLIILPMTLVLTGGGLGGLCGGVALTINLSLLRGPLPAWGRYARALGVTLAAYALYAAAILALQPFMHPRPPAPTYGSSPTMPGPPPGFPGHP